MSKGQTMIIIRLKSIDTSATIISRSSLLSEFKKAMLANSFAVCMILTVGRAFEICQLPAVDVNRK